ncbi:YtfJ family protein [Erwinia sp. S38]|uniref:YtfJ family protein n=1 Tax=Erwinia sp. S38 TaxID=2769338 RepID=UPI00190AAA3E|nr:YtfJ family protein [Erwinia sp. S38]MBK0003536.1 YtfJ family protein [Erwinia sp. S38]
MLLRLSLLLTLSGLPFITSAHNLIPGQPLPPVGVTDRGELAVQQDEIRYQRWDSARLTGKTGIVLHMAGRLAAKESNAALIQAIENARFPAATVRITTIVNTDDAIPGSAMFVRQSLESSKRETPGAQFVVDEKGAVRQAWRLAEGGSAVVVLDKQGRIRFAKDGALTDEQVQQVIALVQQLQV